MRHSPGSAAEFNVTGPQAARAARPPRRLPGARRGFIDKHALNTVMFLRALMTLEILCVDIDKKRMLFRCMVAWLASHTSTLSMHCDCVKMNMPVACKTYNY